LNYAGIQNPYFDSGIIVIINGSLEQVVWSYLQRYEYIIYIHIISAWIILVL
jgi:hypothetical protein